MFICMMIIVSIGFLIKFTLIPGEERWEIYGRNVDLFLFGMDRHEWGTVHLYIGFVLLGLLVLHVYLHWKMIVGLYHQLIASPQVRQITFLLFMAVSVFLIVFPFAVSPKVVEREFGKKHYTIQSGNEHERKTMINQNKIQSNSHEKYTASGIAIDVRGFMTLTAVAQKYNVPIDILSDQLGIPNSAELSEQQLGRLRKIYNFKMADVEKIIYEYRKFH